MTSNDPSVTVLMPVYNGEQFLTQAIDSILKQTFSKFEFLIIDDGSIDSTAKILKSYIDPRIYLIHNQQNLGLVSSLNLGLKLARGQYVARMDADDISLPHRLYEQVKFMESHPEIAVCGSWVKTIGHPSGQIWDYPTDSGNILCQLLFECPLAHPTVILRKQNIEKEHFYYNETYRHAEDYELWVRASKKLTLANLGKVLLLYRCHDEQAVSQHAHQNQQLSDQLRLSQLKELGIHPSQDEIQLHQNISSWRFEKSKKSIHKIQIWLQKLDGVNKDSLTYPESSFSGVLGRRWFMVCLTSACLGIWSWQKFWQSPLSLAANLSWKERISFGIKCGIKFRY